MMQTKTRNTAVDTETSKKMAAALAELFTELGECHVFYEIARGDNPDRLMVGEPDEYANKIFILNCHIEDLNYQLMQELVS